MNDKRNSHYEMIRTPIAEGNRDAETEMEANNHFNYGTHPAASANSGLKRSLGDSLYTNGSSVSFPQQGKNMNGEVNVNGVSTVLGSGVPGSHPPTTPYPHMSNHQSSMGYDYLWGGQAQYTSAMGPSPGHGMHQKQPPSAMMQPQSQHHYQGHGQYQLNGGMGSSHQPPVTGPPSMSSPGGGQYWSRSSPGPHQMGFNSPNVYGSYQSHAHVPGIASSQHHHQQQQSLAPPAHQPSQQHLHSHHHPQHHHHQQQQQQSQHYSMMPNGMPYYQPQQHPPLASPQPPQPTTPSQPQSQASMIPPAPQNFTPPRGSPQHHNVGRGGTSSPLPVSSVSMLSPTSAQESGSPQGQSRERSPRPANAGMPAVMQGNMSETYQEGEAGYNGMEKAIGGQRLPQSDGVQPKPPLPHEYIQHTEQSAAQCPDMAASMREPAVNASPVSMLSRPSGAPATASTPPRLSGASPVASAPSLSALGPATDPATAVVLTPPRVATPPSLTGPPLMVQGLRSPSSSGSQVDLAGSSQRTARSPSHVPALPSKLPALPPLVDNVPRPPVAFSTGATAPASVSNSEGRKMLFPRMTSPYTTSHTTTTALAPSYSGSAPISALQQMVDGPRSPPVTSCFPDPSRAPPEKSQVSGPLTTNSSSPAPPKPCSSMSTPPRLVPSFPSTDNKSVPTLQLQTSSSPTNKSAHTTASASTAPAPVDVELLSSSAQGPASQPLYSLPPSTTQASRTTFVSAPPPLVSSTTAAVAASPVAQAGAVTKTSCVNIPSPQAPKPPPPTVKEDGGEGIGPAVTPVGVAEECPSSQPPDPPETDLRRHSTSLPPAEKPLRTAVSGNEKVCHLTGSGSEDDDRRPESIPQVQSLQLRGTAANDHSMTEEGSFDDRSDNDDTSRSEDNSVLHSISRVDISSSGMEDTSRMDGDSSHVNESTRIDDSSFMAEDPSEFDGTSHMEDEPSDMADTTRDSHCSSEEEEEDEEEDDLGDGSQAGETSRAEETMDSCLSTRDATLESSLNSSSQLEESHVDSLQMEESNVDLSRISASVTDSFGPFHTSTQESEDEAAKECDLPDSAGPIGNKANVNEATPGPASKIMEETRPPIPPITIRTSPATGRLVKTPGKPRKPRTPKASTPVSTPAEKAPRKPRVRTPKVEKIKTPKGEEGKGDEGAKVKGAGRKRKKPLKEEVKDASDVGGAVGPPAGEIDSITAIIEAVLARASEASSAGENLNKPKKVKKQGQEGSAAKLPKLDADTVEEDVENDADDSSTAGESNRRRVATEEQVQFPLLHGWRREIRVRKTESRLKGETWYYTPCGRRMKQFPEIIKYLKRHQDSVVSREHFSFSPRMPIGDFYEERETPEGKTWVLLANEEVPSIIMAITGRRGRPPNPDKEKPRRVRAPKGGQVRRPGRPPKPKMVDLLSKVDAKLLNRLEAKEALSEEDKEKIAKIKKKMKRKARMKRKEDAKNKKIRDEKKKAKIEKDQTVNDQEVTPQPAAEPAPPVALLQASESTEEPKKPGRRKRTKAVVPAPVQQTDEERIAQGKRVLGARSKAKALAKAQAEVEAAAQAALTAKRAAERRAQAQRRLEERKRQQMISDELKKPAEDMCLTDHKPLPELCRIPGVVLSGAAFAHCLTVVEFLHGYGKVIGLNIPKDIPSLATLQEGLLGLGEGQGEVQDLLLKLLEAALHDPGLSSYYQSVKILGDKLADLELTRSTVSEPLRIFLESHGYDTEVCNMLRTKTFHALPPDTKASILGFLVEELNGSNIVISDIDNTLENMATYRKNKWIIEGKLRKLKAALARRTGRSEEELCLEERRRSARVAEEEAGLEESSLLQDRASRRGRKEEPKLSDDSESPTNASIPELERQIDKLTKRQQLFRKKLLQSSHSMRAVALGQDRFRRRYLALPHLGAILVEGPEELLSSEEVLVAEVPVTLLKREPKVEETATPTSPPVSPSAAPAPATTKSQTSSPDDGNEPGGLPGTASLMSQPRGRGRPRKIKPEVELHLRTAKIRRRRRSSVRSGSAEGGPGLPAGAARDLTQAAFQSWLSQTPEPATDGTATGDAPGGQRPEDSVKETAEKRGQWFNLLPKEPCDSSSLTEPQGPPSPSAPRVPLSTLPPALAASLLQSESALPGQCPTEPLATPQGGVTAPLSPSAAATAAPATTPPPLPSSSPALDPTPAPTAPATPSRPVRRRRRGSRGSSPARRGARSAAAKRRGRPPNVAFQELEQLYFTQMVVKPIPASMVRGWWWIQDAEDLQGTLRALNPRGIREKVLHKHLAKHMESLGQMCSKPINDALFQVKIEDDDGLMDALQQPWQVQERVLEVDINALQWVEELEQRVITADLHLKVAPQSDVKTEATEVDPDAPVAEFQPYTAPEPDSTRDDLQYYEHDADPRDDWIVRTKKEWSDLPRVATHALDLAVLRLANLERNIERRYLKEPLWNAAEVMRLAPVTTTPGEAPPMDVMSLESEITPRLRTWRQALDRCRSAPQLCLCILQLEKAVAWERSVVKLNCQACKKGDDDEQLLLCDGCDRGYHMYCLRPKVTQVPEGDWFCPTCTAKEEGDSPASQHSAKKRTRLKKRRYEDDSSDEETASRRAVGMATRHKDTPTPASSSSSSATRFCGDASSATGISPAKRRRMTTRNQPDLTYCEIILMEMEAHADAWPFLEPVNPRLVPGYRRIVKSPMDFLTMRERLLQGGYCNCEEFAADAHLVFNNCELFNEDTSEVGAAGHAMRRFFESRWAEFYDNKDK